MLARAFDETLAVLVEAGYAVLVVVGFAQVLYRFVLESPLSWSEELIRYVFVWSVFLTAAIAFRLDLHIEVDFLTTWYPPRLRRAMALLAWACVVLFVAVLFVLGTQLVLSPSVRLQKSPAMEIPMTLPYAAIPVGSALMMVNVLRAARRTWRGQARGDRPVEIV